MQSQEVILKNKFVLITSANFFTIGKFRFSFILRLIEEGYSVLLYASDDKMSSDSIESLQALGAICIKSGVSRGSYSVKEAVQYIYRYSQIVSKYSPSMVINFTLQPMVFGGFICRLRGIRYISVVTGLGSQYHNNRTKRVFVKFMYSLIVNYSNQVWFVSKSDARVGVEKLGISIDKIRVVYGAGVKIDSKSGIDTVQHNLERKTQILYMGRVRKDKGIEDFIGLARHLSLLPDNSLSLSLMGEMDDSNSYINNIVKKAVEKGLVTRIEFSYDNIKYLKSSDILLLCSRHEGMPTVILESMANWVIPLSASLPVIDELCNMGAKIFTYIPGDVQSLYKAIQEIKKLTSYEIVAIKNNNNKFVSKYFDQDVIANLQYGYFSEVAK